MNTDLVRDGLDDVDEVVLAGGVTIIAVFIAVLTILPTQTRAAVSGLGTVVLLYGGSGYQAVVGIAIAFVVVLFISPWGWLRLGGSDAEPEFGVVSYFAMIFSAGIAAGIVFWGPAEAILHHETPPPGVDAQPGTEQAAVAALQYTLFHWGISAWSIYMALGIAIAFFVYNHGAPLRLSAVLTPFVGVDRLDSYWAKAVDIVAVVATVGGMTATVGLVSSQFIAGVEYRWAVEFGDGGVALFIVAMVVVFTASAVTGVHRGIRRLSLVNVGGFVLLGTIVAVVGPTGSLFQTTGGAMAQYATEFGAMSTAWGTEWTEGWTVFYWSWWLSWAPFVGLFIARISLGRTIRELILTGVAAASLVTMAWFLVIGGTAIHLQQTGRADIEQAIQEGGVAVSGFPLFEVLPFGDVLLFVFFALIITFLVTSADSSTLSIAFLTTTHRTNPSRELRILWGGLQAAVASVVAVVGGVEVLQSAAALTGGVVGIVLVVAVVGVLKESRLTDSQLK